VGVAPITDVVRGDFLNMPFADGSFDAAYAIEATCHAPKVRPRPGALLASLARGRDGR
jgi:hypothetical protein